MARVTNRSGKKKVLQGAKGETFSPVAIMPGETIGLSEEDFPATTDYLDKDIDLVVEREGIEEKQEEPPPPPPKKEEPPPVEEAVPPPVEEAVPPPVEEAVPPPVEAASAPEPAPEVPTKKRRRAAGRTRTKKKA